MSHAPQFSQEKTVTRLERAATLYSRQLDECPKAREVLSGLGITDSEVIDRLRIGWCAGKLDRLLPEDGPVRHDLRRLGIFKSMHAERFENCLVFPMLSIDRHIITLCGIPPGCNRPMFLPGLPPGIWNAPALKLHTEFFVFRTCLEALMAVGAGFPNSIAIPDATRKDPQQLGIFGEHPPGRITFVGTNASSWRGCAEILAGLTDGACEFLVKAPHNSRSVSSYLRALGPEGASEWLLRPSEPMYAPCPSPPETSVPSSSKSFGTDALLVQHAGPRTYEVLDIAKGERKLKATIRATHAGRLHIDTVNLYSARNRRALIQDLALAFDQPFEVVQTEVLRLTAACEKYDPETACRNPADGMSPEEREEAEAFGRDPKLTDRILADYATCGLVGEESNKLLCYFAGVSRKMDTPLSVLLLSSSGAGKSAIQQATLAFCPDEDVVRVTSLTGKALFYRGKESLRHRVLAVEEGAGMEEADYAVRTLISSGGLAVESVERDRGSGELRAVSREVVGPTSVFYTVTDPQIDAETRSRFFVIGVDESREQTLHILDGQRRRQTLDGLSESIRSEAVRRRHHNFQRLLRPLAVVNPYADQLSYLDDRLQARRDQPKYLNLIRAVAFLHQMQRETRTCKRGEDQIEYIEVQPSDIMFATSLAADVLGTSLDELSTPALDLLEQTEAMVRARAEEMPELRDMSEVTFTRRELGEYTGWGRSRLHTHLCELVAAEYVVLTARGSHGLHRYRLIYAGEGRNRRNFILGLRGVEGIGQDNQNSGASRSDSDGFQVEKTDASRSLSTGSKAGHQNNAEMKRGASCATPTS